MRDKIKEIKFIEYKGIKGYIELMKLDVEPLNDPQCESIKLCYDGKDIKAVLDYITNLQQRIGKTIEYLRDNTDRDDYLFLTPSEVSVLSSILKGDD